MTVTARNAIVVVTIFIIAAVSASVASSADQFHARQLRVDGCRLKAVVRVTLANLVVALDPKSAFE
jgi:hypothetical protein